MTVLHRAVLKRHPTIVRNLWGLMLVAGGAVPVISVADDEQPFQWSCSADTSGDWLCIEEAISSENLVPRPARSFVQKASNPEEPRLATVRNLDWVEEPEMTPEQRAALDENCCGAYIEPTRDYPDADIPPEQASLRVNANSTEAMQDDIALLEGDVQISQGYRQVRSDSAVVNQVNRQVVLEGNVRFREPGMLLLGDNAKVDIDSKEVQINNATYVLHEASVRGNAETLSRNKEGIIVIDEATYSACEPGDNTWQLVTSEIDIDQNTGFATVKSARLEVKDVPVFYLPYIRFPVDDRRSSGLLFPTISADKENGLDFAQPIYWNIAPNYDATITPRYIQERGVGIETDLRYLNSWSENQILASFLGSDKGGADDEKIDPVTGLRPNEGEDRYLTALKHAGGAGRPWSTFLDINHVSDMDYFRDLGNLTLDDNSLTHLQRRASASYRTKHWNYSVAAQDYQVITQGLADQYSVLPQISADGYYRLPNSVVIDLKNRHSVFNHSDDSFVTGSRSSIEYGISWDKRWSWGYFKPQVRARHLSYSLDAGQHSALLDASPSVSVPVYSIDTGIYLQRNVSWLNNYKQFFEPRIYYVRADYKDQSRLPDFDTREFTPSYDLLFRENRFNGGDRISDENRMTIAFTSRYIDQKTGQERFRARFAQSIYYADRRVTLSADPSIAELDELSRNQSPLAIEWAARVSKDWRITSDVIYDNHDNELEKSSLGVRYNDGQNRLFNFTYRYTRRSPRLFFGMEVDQDIEQADLSAFVPVAGNFNWVGRWNHDFTNKRELELFAGFEYNSCCWRASLVARRWLDREDEILFPEEELKARNGIFFQIQFKGLAGTGSRVDTMLNNGIYGYEPLETF
ncbi:MAG: LPS-assembly protein LptD [Porticoccaceae bacterium]|nr:LPS-assembly protein LptD [Porticoccaceae bacterium]